MVSLDYQGLGLRTLKIVKLPPRPLPHASIPLFIKVLVLPLPQELTEHCSFQKPHMHRFQVTQKALLPFQERIKNTLLLCPFLPCNSCLFVWIPNPRNHAVGMDNTVCKPLGNCHDADFRLFCIKCKINVFINNA
ncbi:unnamed protein product [Rangifer tarandus platyrhynchus]|uniref:Uncharacterized protein n=2 Tax=Rangifer tarandus platyrhynchus TaxID=3082113 RepID=A0AC59ZCL0_RANTA|nr:unnamed protein product [Rangifer tarandus platyrhynchus]